MPEQEKIIIKSPVFAPKPGWGGKLNNWFSKNFNSKILPVVSVLILIVGLYNFLNNKNKAANLSNESAEIEVIEKIAQPRQGLTHLARAAFADFIEHKKIELTAPQKLFAETYLVTKLNNRLVHAGDTITFKVNDLTETVEKAQTLTTYQLSEWSKYLK